MLEQLFNLVKEQSSELVINNPQIPNEQNNAVMAEATNTVFSGLQNLASGGGLRNILQLFNNNQAGSNGIAGLLKNPIVSMMIGHFVSKLTGKYNVNSNQAAGIANQLIPSILNNLIQRTNDPNNSSFDLNGILGALSGGGQQGGFDIGSLISKVGAMSGDVDGDGDADMQDMIARFTQGAQQQQVQRSGGGIFDMLKGLMQ